MQSLSLHSTFVNQRLEKMKLNRIKLVLVEREISQTQLAKELGKSFSTINAYCSNRKQPSLDLLNKIAEYLSVNIKDLIVDK